MSALALSVLLSLVSAVAYAGGAIVQERVAVSSPDGQYAPLRRPIWWFSLALNGLGGLLHVVALAYGPLSVVQPLGALTIVFALPMAALFVGRRAGTTAWRGAIMATVGLAGLLSLVGASDTHSLGTAQRVAVGLVTAGAVVALMIAGRAAHRHPAVRSVLLATASGIAFGMSSVFTKTATVDWAGGMSAADLPSLAAIGVFAIAGVLLSQASYQGAGLAAPLATLTVVNPVVAAVVGITMFGETFRYGTAGTALALSCGVVAAGGLILLTTERLAHEHPRIAVAGAPDAGAVSLTGPGGGADRAGVGDVLETRPEVAIIRREGALAHPEDAHTLLVGAGAGAGAATRPRSELGGVPAEAGRALPETVRARETVPAARSGALRESIAPARSGADGSREPVSATRADPGLVLEPVSASRSGPGVAPEHVAASRSGADASREPVSATRSGAGLMLEPVSASRSGPGVVPEHGSVSRSTTAARTAAAVGAVPGDEALTELREDVVAPVPVLPVPQGQGPYGDEEPSAASGFPPMLYVPFLDGPFVAAPLLDRHRVRVKA
ncbi:DMT family transporter [Streptomyces bullii]